MAGDRLEATTDGSGAGKDFPRMDRLANDIVDAAIKQRQGRL
jgi:hypothetical protein